MKSALLFSFFLAVQLASAQITDNFSDGDFANNPAWSGDASSFVVNAAGELQLNAPVAGQSLLMTPFELPYACIWDMDVRMEFAASTSNSLRIWLYASEISNNADGYFLEIGESGSTDALRLMKNLGGATQLMATGTTGGVGTDPINVHIQVKRTSGGTWTATLTPSGGNPIDQFVFTEQPPYPTTAQYFGFYCNYTETRKDRFFFDNITVQPDVSDTAPPQITEITVVTDQYILVDFNEPLDQASAEQMTNYVVAGVFEPQSIIWAPDFPTRVELFFTAPFANNQTYQLEVAGVKDWLGNEVASATASFTISFAEPIEPGDIIISEIMADPSPAVFYPESAEWIEIFNHSNKIIDLSELFIADSAGTPRNLPAYQLQPDSSVALAGTSAANTLSAMGVNILGVTSFPSLNNESDVLTLTKEDGTIVDEVAYRSSWHSSAVKKQGGWSLERINPDLLCFYKGYNWSSSAAPNGCTPGVKNSLNNTNYGAETVAKGTVVINEVLFNPGTGGVDFVELLNTGSQDIEWRRFALLNVSKSLLLYPAEAEIVLHPGEHWVFTENPADIMARFDQIDSSLLANQSLPSMDDRSGNISILWRGCNEAITVDSFDYSSEMHSPFLSVGDQDGVSLERIRATGPTQLAANWLSAANNGSPTRENSQKGDNLPDGGDWLQLSSRQISPDNDGYEDYLDVTWQLPDAGYLADLTIFDSEGGVVKKIVKQELAGTKGAFQWNGASDEGKITEPGFYVLFMEAFNAEGRVLKSKKVFTVVRKL